MSVVTGDAVTWTNVSRVHTVTAVGDGWTSPQLVAGDMFTRTFSAVGSYRFFQWVEHAAKERGMIDRTSEH